MQIFLNKLDAIPAIDGVEEERAYAGQLQNFKQGAYNQTNGKAPETNMVWSTGSETYGGDIAKQYANGCYAEVWFKSDTGCWHIAEVRIVATRHCL